MAIDYRNLYQDYNVDFDDRSLSTGLDNTSNNTINYNAVQGGEMPTLNQYQVEQGPPQTGMSGSQVLSTGSQASTLFKGINKGGKLYGKTATGTALPFGQTKIGSKIMYKPQSSRAMISGEPLQLTGTGKYLQAMTGGGGAQAGILAGTGTYIAGRLIRKAFDDADPTTFTAGEVAGAGISGAGAGVAATSAIAKAGILGTAGSAALMSAVPYVGIAAALISIFGGKKKRDKARGQSNNDEALRKFREDRREFYDDYRSRMESESRARAYGQRSAGFNNPYGMGAMRTPAGIYSNQGFMYQYEDGGKVEAVQAPKSKVATLEMIANMINKSKGYSTDAMYDLMNRIAFHESFDWRPDSVRGSGVRRLNPNATQYYVEKDKNGDPIKDKNGNVIYKVGTGKGLFQFEDSVKGEGNTAMNRLAKYFKDNNLTMPSDLKAAYDASFKSKQVDASKLSVESQGILFLVNALTSGDIKMGEYEGFGGTKNINDWWFKNHKRKADDKNAVMDLFTKSMTEYDSYTDKKPYSDGGKKEISAEFTGGESIVNAKDQKKIEESIAKKDFKTAGKLVKKAPLTPGEHSHETNPLPVGKDGMVYNKYGNPTGLRADKGAGIYDHGAKFEVNDEQAGRMAARDIEKWKRNGMYS
jgi:hypothetical protein